MRRLSPVALVAAVAWLAGHPWHLAVLAGLVVWACLAHGAAALYWESGEARHAVVALVATVVGCALVSAGVVMS